MNVRRHGNVLIATHIVSDKEQKAARELGFEYSEMRRAQARPFDEDVVRKLIALPFAYVHEDIVTLEKITANWHVCDPLEIPSKRKAMEHQLIGNRLLLEKKRFALYWEMGTGKTKPTVDVATYLINNKRADKVFVFAPPSVVGTWVTDAIPKDSHLRAVAIVGTAAERRARVKWGVKKNTSFFVFGYPCTRVSGLFDVLMDVCTQNTILILDESTSVKNYKTQQFKRIYEMIKEFRLRYVWLLSGTPVTQSPEDIFGQGACVDTRLFGTPEQYYSFRSRYIVQSTHNKHVVIGYRNLDTLATKMMKMGHRVRSEDVLDLPPKVFQRVDFELPGPLATAYKSFKDTLGILTVKGMEMFKAENPLTVMCKARQIVHNWVYLEVNVVMNEELVTKRKAVTLFEGLISPKLDWIVDTLSTGVPTIIWFAHHGDKYQLQARLLKENIKFVTLDTSVPMALRQNVIDDFQEGRVQVFISNPNLGGEGINLQRARVVIYYNNVHSVKARLQSEARAWRKGTNHKVIIYDLVYLGTADVTVLRTIKAKRKLASMLTDVTPQTLGKLLSGDVYL